MSHFVPGRDDDLLVDLDEVRLATVDKLHASRNNIVTGSLVVEENPCGESLCQDLGRTIR